MERPLVFITTWIGMMGAMMMPSLVPVLRRYRHPAALAAGYFSVWTVFGAVAFAIETLLERAKQQSSVFAHAIPIGLGIALALSGLLQFTEWKRRHLACCRECAPTPTRGAWSDGLRLGVHCCQCCLALMALLIALGMMHLAAISFVAVLIAAERLAPRPRPVVWAVGALILVVGAFRIAQVTGLELYR